MNVREGSDMPGCEPNMENRATAGQWRIDRSDAFEGGLPALPRRVQRIDGIIEPIKTYQSNRHIVERRSAARVRVAEAVGSLQRVTPVFCRLLRAATRKGLKSQKRHAFPSGTLDCGGSGGHVS